MAVRKQWHGFVLSFISHPTYLCAHYHCPRSRFKSRRWCDVHARLYDLEAKKGVCKILNLQALIQERKQHECPVL